MGRSHVSALKIGQLSSSRVATNTLKHVCMSRVTINYDETLATQLTRTAGMYLERLGCRYPRLLR